MSLPKYLKKQKKAIILNPTWIKSVNIQVCKPNNPFPLPGIDTIKNALKGWRTMNWLRSFIIFAGLVFSCWLCMKFIRRTKRILCVGVTKNQPNCITLNTVVGDASLNTNNGVKSIQKTIPAPHFSPG